MDIYHKCMAISKLFISFFLILCSPTQVLLFYFFCDFSVNSIFRLTASLTVMELLSCFTLCSKCSRSSFSSELHLISFCFSSSLAKSQNRNTVSVSCFVSGDAWQKKKHESSEGTFFVSDVGMDNSQGAGPGNGFFFLQDLQTEALRCHTGWGTEKTWKSSF